MISVSLTLLQSVRCYQISPCLSRGYKKRGFNIRIHEGSIDSITTTDEKKIDESFSNNPCYQDEKMVAPLIAALEKTVKQNAAAFYFPGHNRGKGAPSIMKKLIGLKPFLYDLPELPELDNLFAPEGAILDAQNLAAKLFGASETWFLVGGTTCGIQAAIMSTCAPGDVLILPRNAHISAISAMVLSGAVPKYIMPAYDSTWDIAMGVTASQIEKAILEVKKQSKKVAAVLVISPTYHGICSNIEEITKISHTHDIPVIVDEAHGAHFRFHPELPRTALEQGADISVQSTHKVLSSLSQSSMLHMSGNLVNREMICRCLQTLQTTSPNFLLLASLDASRAQVSENPDTIFNGAMNLAMDVRSKLETIPFISVLNSQLFVQFPVIDPLRLTIGVWRLNISGYDADTTLCEEHRVIPELSGPSSLTFAINLGTSKQHIERLFNAIEQLAATNLWKTNISENGRKIERRNLQVPFTDINICLSPREAFFANKRRVNFNESHGQISGQVICTYPPGIPIIYPGEIISEEALSYLLDARQKGLHINGTCDPQLSSILVCDAMKNYSLLL